MLAKLKTIEAEAKKLATEAVTAVETEATKAVAGVEAVAKEVKSNVVSISDAIEKKL